MDEALDLADPRLQGVRPSELSTRAALQMMAPNGRPFMLFENVFPATPSGKVELKSETLATRWGPAALLPDWQDHADEEGADQPLRLISPASDKRITSTMGDLADSRAAPPLMMNPHDAAPRGLADGASVKVWNARGAVILPLVVTDAVPPGVVASEKGAWLATSPTGQTISALVSGELRADLAQGACYNDTRVEVAAA
jgi:anaerobic selenocysteine-containing dehydrogenase